MKRACILLATVAVVIGTFGCKTMTTDEVDRSNIIPKVGLGPSHITASPDPMFTEEGLKQWEKTQASIDFYKFNWKQLEPEKHNQTKHKWPKVTPKGFVRAMNRTGIAYGCEFNQLYYAFGEEEIGKAAAQLVIDGMKPMTDAGGQINSLHIDGIFRILCGAQYHKDPRPKYIALKKAYRRRTPEEAYQEMIEFTQEIKSAWPHCKVGWTVNLPKWRYSKEFDWNDTRGDLSAKLGGLYFMDALEGYTQALRENGMELDFLEVDYPYYHYLKNKRNPEKFRNLQAWCTQNEITYHQIVNAPPRNGAKSFYDGVMSYIEQLHKDGIHPDLMLIQSWYKYPAHHVPETEPYTSTYVGLAAAKKIKALYGDAE